MKIVWSEDAARAFDEVIEQLAVARGHARASRLVDAILAHVSHLADHPQLGRMVPELERPDVRELVQGKHRIVYRVDVDCVEILRVLRPRQQLPRLRLPPVDD